VTRGAALALAAVMGSTVPAAAEGVPVANLSMTAGLVEKANEKGEWSPLAEGDRLRTGEIVRTGADGMARLELPWMWAFVGPDTELLIPSGFILGTVLERGRVQLVADGGDAVKLQAGRADVRGRGRVVVRRDRGRTAVMSQTDVARVSVGGRTVSVPAGSGLVIVGDKLGRPVPLPAPPTIVSPASDPVYLKPHESVSVQWSGEAERYVVEVLPLQQESAALVYESEGTSAEVRVPWLGLYRWRVMAVSASGLESAPSGEGLICVVEK
jgi:hypothetical protein